MKTSSRITLATLAILLTGVAAGANAQEYPNRPITIIVPQAAGGGNDTIARILGERMGRSLGQSFIIENKPGAGGTIGTKQLAQSKPDGYTLAMGSTGTLGIAPTAFTNAGYNPRKDFAPIGLIAKSALVLVVGPSVKANTVQEMIEFAKKNPDVLTYGSGGVSSANHLAAAMFASAAGIKMVHVPFKGAGPAINDVMGGHVSMIFSSLPPILGNVRGGNLRALGTGTTERAAAIPDVPTISEAGLPGYEAEQRYGLIAPAGTPPAIVAKLNSALREALTSDDVKERINADGAVPMPSSPEEYAKDIEAEDTKWSKVVIEAGAKQQ
jgi:tripartite-type tricarboxylate transporter receptor subunit TctC